MSRHGTLAKVAAAAATQDQLRREQQCSGPVVAVNDKKLIEEVWADGQAPGAGGGEKKKKKPAALPPRSENSLWYRLYPQKDREASAAAARRYLGIGEDDGGDDQPALPSDEAMAGALSALAFVNGGAGTDGAGSQGGAGNVGASSKVGTGNAGLMPESGKTIAAPPAAAPSVATTSTDADALKRTLLDALSGAASSIPACQEADKRQRFV